MRPLAKPASATSTPLMPFFACGKKKEMAFRYRISSWSSKTVVSIIIKYIHLGTSYSDLKRDLGHHKMIVFLQGIFQPKSPSEPRLAQWAATRRDLFPDAVCAALGRQNLGSDSVGRLMFFFLMGS